jgi:hypothetical protein
MRRSSSSPISRTSSHVLQRRRRLSSTANDYMRFERMILNGGSLGWRADSVERQRWR